MHMTKLSADFLIVAVVKSCACGSLLSFISERAHVNAKVQVIWCWRISAIISALLHEQQNKHNRKMHTCEMTEMCLIKFATEKSS